MIKLVLVVFCVHLNVLNIFGQDSLQFNQNMIETVKNELVNYIVNKKRRGNEFTSAHTVYTIKFHELSQAAQNLCFSIGYILNSDEISYFSPSWICFVNGEIVLINSTTNMSEQFFLELGAEKINAENRKSAKSKLMNVDEGAFTYEPLGYVYCKDENGVERKYYENTLEMPENRTIHEPLPFPIQIELIEEGKKKKGK